MKKAKNLIILASVLVILLAVYLVYSAINADGGEESGESTTAYPLETIDPSKLVGVDIEITKDSTHKQEESESEESTQGDGGDGEKTTTSLSFALNENATAWLWSEDGEVPLDNSAFANMVSTLSGFSSPYKLENVTNDSLSEYGLTEPYLRVTFTFSDGSRREVKIGAFNPFNEMYYFCDLVSPSTVYMVDESVVSAFDIDVYDLLKYDETPTISSTKITKVTFITDGVTRVYTYYPSGKSEDYTDKYLWYLSIDGSKEAAVDASVAESLTKLAGGITFEDCATLNYKKDNTLGFGGGDRVIIDYKKVDKVTDSTTSVETEVTVDATYTLYLGKSSEDGDIYAHTDSSVLGYVLGESATWSKLRAGSLAGILPDELWLPDYERISSMTFVTESGTKKVIVNNKNGEITYSLDGGEIDGEAFIALQKLLEQTTQTSNTAYLEGDPENEKKAIFSMAVQFTDGKSLTMTAEGYTENYVRVSFGDRNDQLITKDEAVAISDAISKIAK